ncbi:hypothetical protein [Clostridium cibarium]|uniref:Cardiolipin synthase N-terminal domain-containing protein n=1 Tax=Clostridium cibarium TaxID=2762247 RepID=A0ABR8PP73_9CLOT|nr:hypothetical protein [Clostridium cibarium]MBD7909980.1 hypothetical protein [Clostridium cibarium]
MYILVKRVAGSLTLIYLIMILILCLRDLKISKKKKGIIINTILAIWTLISLFYVAGSFFYE